MNGSSYTVDPAGNRTTKTDQHAGVTSNYTYDPLYELTQVTQAANTTESYTYDPVGNRLSSLSVSPYVNNTSNELTSTPNASYSYDYNGNTTSKTVSGGTTNYTWDYENRLASVTLPGTGGSITFKYDPLGRRIQKAFTQNSTTTTTNYLYDGSNAVADIDQNGNVLARYAETQNIDEPLAELRSGTTSYYESDGLGSVTSLTNGAGAIANTYTYDSFGNVTASTGSITNRFQYTAREFDSESGLYYYRARYYDPSTGHFISEDFLRLPDGLSRYDYALNSVTNFIDPLGLCPWQVRQRPLRGALGGVVKNWGDPPPSHLYFYNTSTDQAAGFGPAKDPPSNNPGKEVPGKWEPSEDPSKNPDDKPIGPVPDPSCDCVDRKVKNPGAPPNYCGLGKPHLGQTACTNCWNWVVGVLKECSDEQNQRQNKH